MTLLQSQGDGTCSVKRHEVQFGVNAISGCKLRLKRVDCSHLQQEIYQALHGSLRPEHIAIFGNADPAQKGEWTEILSRNYNVSAMHCTSCCVVPVSLEIQILWAYIGLQSNPQAHVSGARFLYQFQSIQDSQPETEVPLKTVVTFVDITQKPEPPRGQPRMDWKYPFDFFFPFKMAFSRGEGSQKGSIFAIIILCLLLLGVLNLETDWRKEKNQISVFPMGSSEAACLFWLNRSSPTHDQRAAFGKTEDLSEGVELLGHMATLCLIYWETATLLSRVAVPPAIYEGSSFSTSFAIVFILAILDNGCKMVSLWSTIPF